MVFRPRSNLPAVFLALGFLLGTIVQETSTIGHRDVMKPPVTAEEFSSQALMFEGIFSPLHSLHKTFGSKKRGMLWTTAILALVASGSSVSSGAQRHHRKATTAEIEEKYLKTQVKLFQFLTDENGIHPKVAGEIVLHPDAPLGFLKKLLTENRDPKVRASAAKAMHIEGDPEAIPVLAAHSDTAPEVTLACSVALLIFHDKYPRTVEDELLAALPAKETEDRLERIAYFPKEFLSDRTIPIFSRLLDFPDTRTRYATLAKIAEVRPQLAVNLAAQQFRNAKTLPEKISWSFILNMLGTPEAIRALGLQSQKDRGFVALYPDAVASLETRDALEALDIVAHAPSFNSEQRANARAAIEATRHRVGAKRWRVIGPRNPLEKARDLAIWLGKYAVAGLLLWTAAVALLWGAVQVAWFPHALRGTKKNNVTLLYEFKQARESFKEYYDMPTLQIDGPIGRKTAISLTVQFASAVFILGYLASTFPREAIGTGIVGFFLAIGIMRTEKGANAAQAVWAGLFNLKQILFAPLGYVQRFIEFAKLPLRWSQDFYLTYGMGEAKRHYLSEKANGASDAVDRFARAILLRLPHVKSNNLHNRALRDRVLFWRAARRAPDFASYLNALQLDSHDAIASALESTRHLSKDDAERDERLETMAHTEELLERIASSRSFRKLQLGSRQLVKMLIYQEIKKGTSDENIARLIPGILRSLKNIERLESKLPQVGAELHRLVEHDIAWDAEQVRGIAGLTAFFIDVGDHDMPFFDTGASEHRMMYDIKILPGSPTIARWILDLYLADPDTSSLGSVLASDSEGIEERGTFPHYTFTKLKRRALEKIPLMTLVSFFAAGSSTSHPPIVPIGDTHSPGHYGRWYQTINKRGKVTPKHLQVNIPSHRMVWEKQPLFAEDLLSLTLLLYASGQKKFFKTIERLLKETAQLGLSFLPEEKEEISYNHYQDKENIVKAREAFQRATQRLYDLLWTKNEGRKETKENLQSILAETLSTIMDAVYRPDDVAWLNRLEEGSPLDLAERLSGSAKDIPPTSGGTFLRLQTLSKRLRSWSSDRQQSFRRAA